MTRIVTTAAAILIMTTAMGCQSDTGRSRRLPPRTGSETTQASTPLATPASTNEIDLVEQLTSHREAYRRSLLALEQYYDTTGNHQKTVWAQQERKALDQIPMYRYIAVADVFPATLKATESIPAADQLFAEAEQTRRQAGTMVPDLLKNEDVLRKALGKYADMIRQYPTSDKIDDAAFRMADIHEVFNDFQLALQYYQRAYQWDPATPYPARFKAANILDRKLYRRAEALELYQEAIVKEAQFGDWRRRAEQRIKDLSTSNPK